jgi:ParB/RepB/Spo0J family partition protein
MDLMEISLDDLEFAEDNVREKADGLDERAQSIAASGIIVPLSVSPLTDGKYRIVAGERRTRAALLVRAKPDKYPGPHSNITSVPAVVEERSDSERMVAMLIENLQRVDISPLEEAKGYAKLVGDGAFTQQDIAARVGRSKAHISKRLTLLSLPASAHKALVDGRINIDTALGLAKLAEVPEVIDRLVATTEGEYPRTISQWDIERAQQAVETVKEHRAVVAKVRNLHPTATVYEGALTEEQAIELNDGGGDNIWTWIDEGAAATWDGTLPEGATHVEVSVQHEGIWLAFYGYLEPEWTDPIAPPTAKQIEKHGTSDPDKIAELEAEAAEARERNRITRTVDAKRIEHERLWQASVSKKPKADDLKALYRNLAVSQVTQYNAKEIAAVLDIAPIVRVETSSYNKDADGNPKQTTVKDFVAAVKQYAGESALNADRVTFVVGLRWVTPELDEQLRQASGYEPFDEKRALAEAKAKAKTPATK